MDTPPLERSARAPRRRGSSLSIASGLVLAACFFLPAIDDCGRALSPLDVASVAESPWILLFMIPYLLGLVIAIIGIAMRRTPDVGEVVTALYATVALLLFSTSFVVLYIAVSNPLYGLIPLATWIGMAYVMGTGRRLSHERRAARASGVAGGMCAAWFSLFVLMSLANPLPYYGAWVSFAAAIGLIIGGYRAERSLVAHQ